MKFNIDNIDWDIDEVGNGVENDLPKSISNADIKEITDTTPSYEYDELISDWLSDEYGWCVKGFTFQQSNNEEDGTDEYSTTIELPKADITKWNDLLSEDSIDFNEHNFKDLETVFKRTAKFENGCEVDLKVNTTSSDRNGRGQVYAEMVLFDENGNELVCSEPCYEMDGACWYLYYGSETYRVDVIGI